jgi:hypothetical protein
VTIGSPAGAQPRGIGIDIDAVPGGHLVALSRAGQTFRASVTPSNRKGRSIFVLHLSLLRLLHENAHKIHQVGIWWCANPKESYTVHVFQN